VALVVSLAVTFLMVQSSERGASMYLRCTSCPAHASAARLIP
jgi:hypothetical protein